MFPSTMSNPSRYIWREELRKGPLHLPIHNSHRAKTGKGEIAKKIIEHYVAQGLVSDEYREALYNDLVNRLPPGKSGLKKL